MSSWWPLCIKKIGGTCQHHVTIFYQLAFVEAKAASWLASNKLANEEESLSRLKFDFIVIKHIAISYRLSR